MPPIARAVRSPTDLTTKLRLPTFATTTARHVPGPAGSPSLAVVHGGEVIRQGAHDDAMVGAINNLSEAIGTIRSGDMSVQPKIVVSKSHLAQAVGLAAILNGHKVVYRETYVLLEEIADATLDGTRKELMARHESVPLLLIDDLGMRKLPAAAAEDLLEIIMRRHKRASTILTSNRPVDDWGKLLGDTPAVSAMLDRLLDDGHVIKCGPKSWRTRKHADLPSEKN